MNLTTFDGVFKATADQAHPLQTNIEFVFTDFRPNRNRQGVPLAEADNIIRTGVNMPVKVNFTGGKIRGHSSAVPIGPITMMEQQGDKIIGRAIIWKDEFPELTSYLEEASKGEGEIQFSWELYYKSAKSDTSGVSWLEDCLVAGAAIVADPAYGGRTHLLALAEEQNIMDMNELQSQVSELTDKLWGMIEALYAALALPGAADKAAGIEAQFSAIIDACKGMASTNSAQAEIIDEQSKHLVGLPEKLAALNTELDSLREFKQNAEAEKAKAELLASRYMKLKDLLASAEFDAKSEFIGGLSDEQFTVYTETLQGVAARHKSVAGTSNQMVPDPLTAQRGETVTTADLAKALRASK